MTRNKKLASILVLALSALSACTTRDESILWKEYDAQKQAVPERRPAQGFGSCFGDRFDTLNLSKGINELEAVYSTQKSRAYKFGGQDFPALRPAVIDFLNSSWIATNPLQANCKEKEGDCFVRALYAAKGSDPTGQLEGLAHYWFFLKTGVVASAQKSYPWYRDSRITAQSAAGLELNNYLFDENEWRAWWKMANLLPPSMLQMDSLKTIHRIPRGGRPTEWKNRLACGVSFGSKESGMAVFDQDCLSLSAESPLNSEASYFFVGTTHEFAHRLVGQAMVPDFMKLSSWRRYELVTPEGRAQAQWNSDQAAGFVSSDARMSPEEDFAESVAYFRTHPEWTLKKSKSKYDYIRKAIFEERGYVPADLTKLYAATAGQNIFEKIDTVLGPCLKEKPDTAELVNPAFSQFKELIKLKTDNAALGSCVKIAVLNQINQSLLDIRFDQPEGCGHLAKAELEVAKIAVESIGTKLDPYLKKDFKLADLSKALTEFRESVTKGFDDHSAILSCWAKADARACYNAKLEGQLAALVGQFGATIKTATPDLLDNETARFKEKFSYDQMMAKATSILNGLMSEVTQKISEQAESLWVVCHTSDSTLEADKAKIDPYSAGSYSIPPAVLDCLNRGLIDASNELPRIAAFDKGLTTVEKEARAWIIKKILLPQFESVFNQKLAAAQAEDQKRFQKLSAGVAASIAESMPTENFAIKTCKTEAGKRLQEKLQPSQFPYYAIEPELEVMGDQVCEKARIAAAQKPMTTAQTNPQGNAQTMVAPQEQDVPVTMVERVSEALWMRLAAQVLDVSKSRFTQCRGNEYKSSRLRRYCLFSEWTDDDQDQLRKNAWAWTRDRGIRAWLKDPEVVQFRSQRGYKEEALFAAARIWADADQDAMAETILAAFKDQ